MYMYVCNYGTVLFSFSSDSFIHIQSINQLHKPNNTHLERLERKHCKQMNVYSISIELIYLQMDRVEERTTKLVCGLRKVSYLTTVYEVFDYD